MKTVLGAEGFTTCRNCGGAEGFHSTNHGHAICTPCYFGYKPGWRILTKDKETDMADRINREEAQSRKLQGEHSAHHTASGVPDRHVQTHTEDLIPAGTNPSPKTDLGTGEAQESDSRDTSYQPTDMGHTGEPSSGGSDEPTEQAVEQPDEDAE
jgi:hypothetical protein